MPTIPATYEPLVAALGVALALIIAIALFRKRRGYFSERYLRATSHANPHWRRLRRQTLAITLGRDCLFPWLRATEIHHLTYRNLEHEVPWFDVVPLNSRTHAWITSLRSWGFKEATNIVLRLALGIWLLGWLAIPGIPLGIAIAVFVPDAPQRLVHLLSLDKLHL